MGPYREGVCKPEAARRVVHTLPAVHTPFPLSHRLPLRKASVPTVTLPDRVAERPGAEGGYPGPGALAGAAAAGCGRCSCLPSGRPGRAVVAGRPLLGGLDARSCSPRGRWCWPGSTPPSAPGGPSWPTWAAALPQALAMPPTWASWASTCPAPSGRPSPRCASAATTGSRREPRARPSGLHAPARRHRPAGRAAGDPAARPGRGRRAPLAGAGRAPVRPRPVPAPAQPVIAVRPAGGQALAAGR